MSQLEEDLLEALHAPCLDAYISPLNKMVGIAMHGIDSHLPTVQLIMPTIVKHIDDAIRSQQGQWAHVGV